MPKLWECCRSTPWFIVEINRVGVVLYQGTIPSEGAEGPRSYSAVKELLFLWGVQLERPKYIQWKLQLNTTRNEIQSRLHSRHPFHALQSSWLVVIVIVMSEDEWTISPDYSASVPTSTTPASETVTEYFFWYPTHHHEQHEVNKGPWGILSSSEDEELLNLC